ncbi:hypothetical protein M2272_000790 [Mycobacterium frederiksbergense]|uniref:Transposase n=1 Tax=Mycolicibacterium frederiksbergense TaxID=117567 RepID=A0ABT6KTX8_9MYCO|nr:hypothetical protein [Mycolicibacterium frederiksbergense]
MRSGLSHRAAVSFVDGIIRGEGPRWHGGRLWCTDGLAGRVYSVGRSVSGQFVVLAGLRFLRRGGFQRDTFRSLSTHSGCDVGRP